MIKTHNQTPQLLFIWSTDRQINHQLSILLLHGQIKKDELKFVHEIVELLNCGIGAAVDKNASQRSSLRFWNALASRSPEKHIELVSCNEHGKFEIVKWRFIKMLIVCDNIFNGITTAINSQVEDKSAYDHYHMKWESFSPFYCAFFHHSEQTCKHGRIVHSA